MAEHTKVHIHRKREAEARGVTTTTQKATRTKSRRVLLRRVWRREIGGCRYKATQDCLHCDRYPGELYRNHVGVVFARFWSVSEKTSANYSSELVTKGPRATTDKPPKVAEFELPFRQSCSTELPRTTPKIALRRTRRNADADNFSGRRIFLPISPKQQLTITQKIASTRIQ